MLNKEFLFLYVRFFVSLCSRYGYSKILSKMDSFFIRRILEGNNYPSDGQIVFDSSDHIRFQNGNDVSGHNYGCNRRLIIEKNIQGNEGYTVIMYNLDGIHPIWQNNIQMAPKQMKIVNVNGNIVELRGYGYDENALAMGAPLEVASFENYGVVLMIEGSEIVRAQLNMFDKNVSIVYLK
ncbi:MAG: hypothetical protein LUC91_01435 [Prevotella sp.]|nr:hypothetical protein [Prevotella sp.]